jgi:hypothetical protein
LFVDGRASGKKDGGESERGLEVELVEALDEELTSGGVTVALEKHMVDRLEWGRGGGYSDWCACGMRTGRVDGSGASLVEAQEDLTGARAVEEETSSTLGL